MYVGFLARFAHPGPCLTSVLSVVSAEFRNMFVNPIMNGQHADSTADDIRQMRFRVHVLRSLLNPFVQRYVEPTFF